MIRKFGLNANGQSNKTNNDEGKKSGDAAPLRLDTYPPVGRKRDSALSPLLGSATARIGRSAQLGCTGECNLLPDNRAVEKATPPSGAARGAPSAPMGITRIESHACEAVRCFGRYLSHSNKIKIKHPGTCVKGEPGATDGAQSSRGCIYYTGYKAQ